MTKVAYSGCGNEQDKTGKAFQQKFIHYAPLLMLEGILFEILITMRTDHE
jgi:hypothetical protein